MLISLKQFKYKADVFIHYKQLPTLAVKLMITLINNNITGARSETATLRHIKQTGHSQALKNAIKLF